MCLSNLFCGYNPNRVWNVIPFVGAGLGRNMSDNINVVDLKKDPTSNYTYLLKAERVIRYWYILKGDYSFSETVNSEVFLGRMDFKSLKEVSEEQVYEAIEKLLKGFIRSYERKARKTN